MMTPEEFKTLVRSKGTQADVAEAVGWSLRLIEDLCNGRRVIHLRHVRAVEGLLERRDGEAGDGEAGGGE